MLPQFQQVQLDRVSLPLAELYLARQAVEFNLKDNVKRRDVCGGRRLMIIDLIYQWAKMIDDAKSQWTHRIDVIEE